MEEALKKIVPLKIRLVVKTKFIPFLIKIDFFLTKLFFWQKFNFYKKLIAQKIYKKRFFYLNVGCGPKGIKGWLNIGIFPNFIIPCGLIIKKNEINYLNYDLNLGIPTKNNSIKNIYNSHFIEHLNLREGIKFYQEAFRVLKKGGIIRTSCPDLEKYAKKYIERDQNFYNNNYIKKFCYYPEAKTPGEIFIAKAYDDINKHAWFYDIESLTHLMKEAGFKKIEKKEVHQSQIKDIKEIEPKYRAIESLYVEAKKI